MNQKTEKIDEDEIPEIDFSGGVRGKYFDRYQEGRNIVLLDPDLARVFRDSAGVNKALREYLAEHGTPAPTTK